MYNIKNSASLYIHIPFCKQKCAYCSFYSKTSGNTNAYVDALTRAIKSFGGAKINTVYIGGGTPSVLTSLQIQNILNAVHGSFNVDANAEITVEANPESVTPEFLKVLKQGGVNRLSLGVQSLNDSELVAIGRLHSAKGAIDAINLCKSHGFLNLSCDLIFGLPYQTMASLKATLTQLLTLDIAHISCYNLQLEQGTRILKLKDKVPSEELQEQMYFYICNTLENSGYTHYEISNFCKSGFKAQHNSVYWQGGDYIGLGPSAHSFINGVRYSYDANIDKFINRQSFEFDQSETVDNPMFEKIMLGLRTDTGIEISQLKNSGEYINRLVKGGFAVVNGGVLTLTDKGFYLSNTIISDITAKEC